MEFNERARQVLSQVVNLHYTTCEPVGSALIHKTKVIPFSPATIRNIMMRLENKGYLIQPHTSAGRLPTDLGYRAYVDGLSLGDWCLNEMERRELEDVMDKTSVGPRLLECVANYIQRKTGLVTFHIPFHQSGVILKHLHFERISENRVLVLWISQGGQTFQTVLPINEDELSNPMIEKAENFINSAFEGQSLQEIQAKIARRFSFRNGSWDILLSKTARITNALLEEVAAQESLHYSGMGTMLEMPEFQTIARVKVVLRLFEEQQRIRKLIEILRGRGDCFGFFIGEEISDPELSCFAVVLAVLGASGRELGCIGVLGPKRMPYLRSMQILSFAREKAALMH